MYKILILSLFFLISFTGCTNKVYTQPYVKIGIYDKETKKPLKGVEVQGINSYVTDLNGTIEQKAIYQAKYDPYPLPLPTHGSLIFNSFHISHPGYNYYNFECSFTSLSSSGECYPRVLNKLNKDTKKELLLIWENKTIEPCKDVKINGTGALLSKKLENNFYNIVFLFKIDENLKHLYPKRFYTMRIGNDWGKKGLDFTSMSMITNLTCKNQNLCLNNHIKDYKIGSILDLQIFGDIGACAYDSKSLKLKINVKQ